MMSQINIDKLHEKNCAITDITTLLLLDKYHENLFHLKISTETIYDNCLKLYSLNPEFLHVLDIVERLVVYDFIVYDFVASKYFKLNIQENNELIKPILVPENIYVETLNQLRGKNDVDLSRYFGKVLLEDDDGYKEFFDSLAKESETIARISRSHQSADRVLFYIKLASHLKLPIMLNPYKDEFLYAYQKKFTNDVLKQIETHIDRKLSEAFINILGDNNESALPPLAGYILRKAYKNKICIIDVVNDLRERKETKKFKAWLSEVQKLVLSNDRPAWIEAGKMMLDFQKQVEIWVNNMDFDEGVSYKTMSLKIGLPSEILGINVDGLNVTKEIKDPLLGRPLYLAFISSWYKK